MGWLPWSWFTMIFHDLPWFSMIFHDLPWFSMIYHDFPWCSMIFHYYLPWFSSQKYAFFILAACKGGFRDSAVIATIRNAQSQQQPSGHDAETARSEPEKGKEEARATAKNAQASRREAQTAGNKPKTEERSRKVTTRKAQASRHLRRTAGKNWKKMRFEGASHPEPKRDRVQLVAKARKSRIQKEQFFSFLRLTPWTFSSRQVSRFRAPPAESKIRVFYFGCL